MEELQAFEAWKHVMYNLGLRKQYRPNMIALQVRLGHRLLFIYRCLPFDNNLSAFNYWYTFVLRFL